MPLILETLQALHDLVGREIGVTEWFQVTQKQINDFAKATGDHQWIHVDRERAGRESPHGTTIVHGFLTLSLLSRFLGEALQVKSGIRTSINYGLNRVRFPAPVPSEGRIRCHFTLKSVKDLPGAMEAVFDAKVEIEGGEKPCCIAEWVLRYYS